MPRSRFAIRFRWWGGIIFNCKKIKASRILEPKKLEVFTATELSEGVRPIRQKLFTSRWTKKYQKIRPIPTSKRTSSATVQKMSASIISSTSVKETLETKQNALAKKEIKKKLKMETELKIEKTIYI